MSDKILETAKKLKALSDRGIDGERENAIDMLKRYMDKHNITAEMLEGREVKDHEVFLENDQKKFFNQVCASVLGLKFAFFKYKYKLASGKDKYRYGLTCTDAEFIEIKAKFDFYYKIYLDELAIFYEAFIQAQGLYGKDNGEPRPPKELTAEERANLLKMLNLMQSIDKKHFLKQLE